MAFLFNQMGNALNFQTKFKRIEELREEQAYIAMWQEYGDLVYIIWTFQPLEEAAMEAEVDSKVEQWFLDHEWMADSESDKIKKDVLKAGVSAFTRGIKDFGDYLQNQAYEFVARRKAAREAAEEAYRNREPVVQEATTQEKVTDVTNGVFEGVTDVFGYDSNQVRCRTNFTVGYDAGNRMANYFAAENRPLQWGDATFQENFITDTSYILKFPFGVCYSCFWGYLEVMDTEDESLSQEDQELTEMILIRN